MPPGDASALLHLDFRVAELVRVREFVTAIELTEVSRVLLPEFLALTEH